MSVLFIIIALALVGLGITLPNHIKIKQYQSSDYYNQTKNSLEMLKNNKGIRGEYLIYQKLDQLSGHKRFLFNCYFVKENGDRTEIDILFLHSTGIYVIESKNYSGWIFGTETDKRWTQSLLSKSGRPNKNQFFNPIIQNKVHLKALAYYLGDDSLNFHSYIVFGNDTTLKKITLTSSDHHVVCLPKLLEDIHHTIRQTPPSLSPQKIERLYKSLLPLTKRNQGFKELHIQQVQKAIKRQSPKTQKKPTNKLNTQPRQRPQLIQPSQPSQTLKNQSKQLTKQPEQLSQTLEKQTHQGTKQPEQLAELLKNQRSQLAVQPEQLAEMLKNQRSQVAEQPKQLTQTLEKQTHQGTKQPEQLAELLKNQKSQVTEQPKQLRQTLEKLTHQGTKQPEQLTQTLEDQKNQVAERLEHLAKMLENSDIKVTEQSEQLLKVLEEKLIAEKEPLKSLASNSQTITDDLQSNQQRQMPKGQVETNKDKHCPRCNHSLALRVTSKGEQKGQRFWGCSRFPKCWYTQKIAET